MLNGIDVYEGNNINSWEQVKNSGISVVIQKATQNCHHIDSLLYYRAPKIKQAGLNIGYYHFAEFNSTVPIQEAQHFITAIQNLPLTTLVWLDIECEDKWNRQNAINYVNGFIDYMNNHGYVNKIGLYTSEDFYNVILKNNIPNIPLWIANYGRQPATYPTHSWQYSETGRVGGVVGNVDKNYFREDILLSNSQPQSQPTYKQPNNFCKNSVSPILPYPFETTTNVLFKSAPDNNAPTNATRGVGFQVYCYGKDGDFFSVNKNGTQFLSISSLRATKPLNVQKVVRISDYNGVKCYENCDNTSLYNGTVPYNKTCVVYWDSQGYYLVNGNNANLQFINNNNQLEDVYPNAFTNKLNVNSEPLLVDFQVNVDRTNIKEFPHEWSKTVGNLKKGELVQVYAKCHDYYLISSTEKKFIKIEDLVATKPLSIIKKVKCVAYEGSYARENPTTEIKNNGIIPCNKELLVYKEIGDWYLLNGSNANLQWALKDDFIDLV